MREARKIIVLDDDKLYCDLIAHYLSLNPDNEVFKFNSAHLFLQELPKIKPHIVTLDYSLPDGDGGELLKKVKSYNNKIQVILISGQEDVKTALTLLKEGAYDYLVKDEDTKEKLWSIVNKLTELEALHKQVDELRTEVISKFKIDTILKGESHEMKQVHLLIEKAAATNISVSISGETGTGKELVAKAVHFNSKYADKPFVALNIAAIPSELAESELFGHEKGAFTGAAGRRIGKLEEANGGTLFLDEIGEMDLSLQAKLLRALQEREITRVGSNQTIKVSFRLIVATHKKLLNEVKAGRFREDLYYRIFGFPIEMPPLAQRGQDVILLAQHFLKAFCAENKMPPISMDRSARERLMKYSWPGNVRELKSVIELSAVMSGKQELTESDIAFTVADSEEKILLHEMTLEEYEKEIIRSYLKKYNNNVVLVAEKLKIGKSTIYNMLQRKAL